MNFDEWMDMSEEMLGTGFMKAFDQYCLGNISFDEWLDIAYESMTEKQKVGLCSIVSAVEGE